MGEPPLMDIPGIITSLGTLIAAIGALVISIRNSRKSADAAAAAEAARLEAIESKQQIVKVGNKLYRVSKQIDGRMTALLDQTERLAIAEGKLQGREAEKAGEPEESEKKKNGDPIPKGEAAQEKA